MDTEITEPIGDLPPLPPLYHNAAFQQVDPARSLQNAVAEQYTAGHQNIVHTLERIPTATLYEWLPLMRREMDEYMCDSVDAKVVR